MKAGLRDEYGMIAYAKLIITRPFAPKVYRSVHEVKTLACWAYMILTEIVIQILGYLRVVQPALGAVECPNLITAPSPRTEPAFVEIATTLAREIRRGDAAQVEQLLPTQDWSLVDLH